MQAGAAQFNVAPYNTTVPLAVTAAVATSALLNVFEAYIVSVWLLLLLLLKAVLPLTVRGPAQTKYRSMAPYTSFLTNANLLFKLQV